MRTVQLSRGVLRLYRWWVIANDTQGRVTIPDWVKASGGSQPRSVEGALPRALRGKNARGVLEFSDRDREKGLWFIYEAEHVDDCEPSSGGAGKDM